MGFHALPFLSAGTLTALGSDPCAGCRHLEGSSSWTRGRFQCKTFQLTWEGLKSN